MFLYFIPTTIFLLFILKIAKIKLGCLRKLQQLSRLFCENVSFKIFKSVGGSYGHPWLDEHCMLIKYRGAFHYEANYDYTLHPSVVIGKMNKLCVYCSALEFKNKTPEMCCTGGKVKLLQLHPTPEPISNLVSGGTGQLKYFLANTITCKHSECKNKFIIVLDNYYNYNYRMQITNFFKFIS